MDEPKTIQAAFRLPPETLEWLDQYAAFLSQEGGFGVSRTQALLRLISLARPEEQWRMANQKYAIEMGFRNTQEFIDWQEGVMLLTIHEREKYKKLNKDYGPEEMEALNRRCKDDELWRGVAINAGKEGRYNSVTNSEYKLRAQTKDNQIA